MFAKLSEEYQLQKVLYTLPHPSQCWGGEEGQTETPDSTSAFDLREEERETCKWEVMDYEALAIRLLAGCLCSQH